MRLALRSISREKGFTALAVLSMAAAIGFIAALASVADAILEAAKVGERNPARLTAFAVAVGSAVGNSRIRRTRHAE